MIPPRRPIFVRNPKQTPGCLGAKSIGKKLVLIIYEMHDTFRRHHKHPGV